MHPLAADAIVESVRRRVAQGDHPTEPATSVENLEECLLTLADSRAHLQERHESLREVVRQLRQSQQADFASAIRLVGIGADDSDGWNNADIEEAQRLVARYGMPGIEADGMDAAIQELVDAGEATFDGDRLTLTDVGREVPPHRYGGGMDTIRDRAIEALREIASGPKETSSATSVTADAGSLSRRHAIALLDLIDASH